MDIEGRSFGIFSVHITVYAHCSLLLVAHALVVRDQKHRGFNLRRQAVMVSHPTDGSVFLVSHSVLHTRRELRLPPLVYLGDVMIYYAKEAYKL